MIYVYVCTYVCTYVAALQKESALKLEAYEQLQQEKRAEEAKAETLKQELNKAYGQIEELHRDVRLRDLALASMMQRETLRDAVSNMCDCIYE